ncbi:MAG: class I SAM-dependent methyltransferase [bacterium]
MHKFNPENHKRLDSDQRYKLMPPELLIDEIEKTAAYYFKNVDAVTFADLGCGSGYFSIPLAKRIKKSFKDKNAILFALDISSEMLGIFNDKLKKELGGAINNCEIKCVKCEEFFIPLEDNSVNILLMANVFHEIEDKPAYLQEIKRVLKDGGTFFLLDWKKEDVNPVMGPPAGERVSSEEAVKILKESGFKDISILPIYPSSFTLISKK